MISHLMCVYYSVESHYSEESLGRWLEETEQFGMALGYPPTHCYARLHEKTSRLRTSKTYTWKRKRESVLAEHREGNLLDAALWATEPKWQQIDLDIRWYSDCSNRMDRDRGLSRFLREISDYVAAEAGRSLRELANESLAACQRYFRPSYGLATLLPRDWLPNAYGIGMPMASMPSLLRCDANDWFIRSRFECDRVVRNVCGLNVLGAGHLELQVGGIPFRQWVSGAGHRGRLEPLGEGLWLWTFEGTGEGDEFLRWDHPAVAQTRRELMAEGFFPWQSGVRVDAETEAEIGSLGANHAVVLLGGEDDEYGRAAAEVAAEMEAELRQEGEDTIQNLDTVDMVVKMSDGGVRLIIVASRGLDDRLRTQLRLIEKVENYVKYIKRRRFQREYGPPSLEKTWIVIESVGPIGEESRATIEELRRRLEKKQIRLVVGEGLSEEERGECDR